MCIYNANNQDMFFPVLYPLNKNTPPILYAAKMNVSSIFQFVPLIHGSSQQQCWGRSRRCLATLTSLQRSSPESSRAKPRVY